MGSDRMAGSRRIVESVLERDPVIRKGLERGIINSRALARFIQKTTQVEATPDAILGYIRRYPVDGEDSTEYGLVLKDSDIKMKSKVGVLEIDHGPQTMRLISEFAGTVKTTRGENLRVLCGTRCIRVIADQKALAQLKQNLRDKEIIQYAENLVEVSLLLSPAAEHADGIYNRITAQLAMNDLHAIAILFCGPEAILIVREEDSVRALEVLQEMLSDTFGALS
jgi:hypothetical protein